MLSRRDFDMEMIIYICTLHCIGAPCLGQSPTCLKTGELLRSSNATFPLSDSPLERELCLNWNLLLPSYLHIFGVAVGVQSKARSFHGPTDRRTDKHLDEPSENGLGFLMVYHHLKYLN